jgi:membrane protein YqaA with SNARE-associated domain
VQFIKSFSLKLGSVLALYGGWGLCAISFLDSSLIPLPGVNDLALIVMVSKHPLRAPFYVLMSTIGSILGCYVLYGMGRAGGKLAGGEVPSEKPSRARRWLERNDFASMLVMSLLPPPAPFKAFVLAAGGLRMNALNFGAALLVGRGLRFAAEAWLGVHYGAEAQAYLKANFGWVSLLTILVIVGLTLLSRWWKSGRAAGSGDPA